ncbi:hypothetical protein TARUN_2818 [Trichoderma arundinaceum]|uniref:Uncharacterized protein n=1 Tax=Trichoderma arundinaceum TaxID=490622 RepID=A0A395NTV7_TRIAR|nr:hypothetical protein TARUN_2818 [Trichoderma arundinaceum]
MEHPVLRYGKLEMPQLAAGNVSNEFSRARERIPTTCSKYEIRDNRRLTFDKQQMGHGRAAAYFLVPTGALRLIAILKKLPGGDPVRPAAQAVQGTGQEQEADTPKSNTSHNLAANSSGATFSAVLRTLAAGGFIR